MKKIFVAAMVFMLGLSFLGSPAMATKQTVIFGDQVEAAILKDCAGEENGHGESIACILKLVVNIMTIGIGILGVIGISVAGIQYLTAGGNEEKTRKAKRRIFEVVIGMAVYVVLFGIIQWLGLERDEAASNAGANNNETSVAGTNNAGTSMKASKKSNTSPKKTTSKNVAIKNNTGVDKNGTSANGRKVMKMAEEIAARMGKAGNIYYENNSYGIKNWNDIKTKRRSHCAQYVSIVLQETGLIPKNKTFCLGHGRAVDCGGNNGSWSLGKDDSFKATYYSDPGKSIAYLVKNKKMVPGDIVGKGDGWHTMIYRGEKNGKYYFYSVGPQKKNGQLVPFTKDWIINRTYPGDYMIGNVYRPK